MIQNRGQFYAKLVQKSRLNRIREHVEQRWEFLLGLFFENLAGGDQHLNEGLEDDQVLHAELGDVLVPALETEFAQLERVALLEEVQGFFVAFVCEVPFNLKIKLTQQFFLIFQFLKFLFFF